MSSNHPFQFPFVRIVLGVLFAVLVLTATFVRDGTAYADTPGTGQDIGYINFFLSGFANVLEQRNYNAMISNLRSAAGHSYRGNAQITQTDRNGLVGLSVYVHGGGQVTLWYTASNLYLRGFQSANNGTIFRFHDNDFDLVTQVNRRLNTHARGVTLNFSGSYSQIVANTGHTNRGNLQISYQSISNAITTLAQTNNVNAHNQQQVAQSLLLMIQWTSEAARFNNIFGVMSDVMSNPNRIYHGLSGYQQNLENSWDPISSYGRAVSQNPNTPPRFINGVGTLHSFLDVAYLLAMLSAFPTRGSQQF